MNPDPLDTARAYLRRARDIAEDENRDPDRALEWAVHGGAGKWQRAHLEAAGACALVSIAESLAALATWTPQLFALADALLREDGGDVGPG